MKKMLILGLLLMGSVFLYGQITISYTFPNPYTGETEFYSVTINAENTAFTVTFFGHTATFPVSDLDLGMESQYYQWLEDIIAEEFGLYGSVSSMSAANPVTSSNRRALLNTFSAVKVQPTGIILGDYSTGAVTPDREEGEEKDDDEEKGEAGVPPAEKLITDVKADVETNFSSYMDQSMTNSGFTATLTGTTPDRKLSLGVGGSAGFLSIDGSSYVNTSLDTFMTYYPVKTPLFEFFISGTMSLLVNDADLFGEDNVATNLLANGGFVLRRGNTTVCVTGMTTFYLTRKQVGNVNSIYVSDDFGLGVLVGFPLGNSLSLNTYGLYVVTPYASFDGRDASPEEVPRMLELGGSVTVYFSPVFGLEIGLKSIMLVDDYSHFGITLGSGFSF